MTSLGAIALVHALLAASPVVLVEKRIEQYKVAAGAAERRLADAVEADPADADLAGKLADAPVVVAVGRKALAAAKARAGPRAAVVFCMVLGVTSADLGPAVTGVPLESDPKEVFARLHAVVPGARKVGVVYDPRGSGLLIERARAAASASGLTLVAKPVGAPGEVKDAVDGLVGGIDALWLPPDPRLFSRELSEYLLSTASEHRLALVGFLESFTEAGALASVSPNYGDIGDRAGKLAAELLAKPESQRLPVPPPVYAPGDLSINLKTAQALGFNVPQAAVGSAQHVVR